MADHRRRYSPAEVAARQSAGGASSRRKPFAPDAEQAGLLDEIVRCAEAGVRRTDLWAKARDELVPLRSIADAAGVSAETVRRLAPLP